MGKAKYRPRVSEGLTKLPGSGPAQRLKRVMLLGRLPHAVAMPALRQLLQDPNPWVRRRAEHYHRLTQPPAKATDAVPGGSDVIREGGGQLPLLLKKLPPPTMVIDTGRCTVLYNEQAVALTAAEFRLLLTLARHQGRYVTKATLYSAAIDDHGAGENNTALKNLIKKLRRKLGDNGQTPALISCLRNYGYRLNSTITIKIVE